MTTAGALTLAIAMLGAFLGIINTLMQMDRNRVKIRVVPKIAFFVDGAVVNSVLGPEANPDWPQEPRLCVEVINLSFAGCTNLIRIGSLPFLSGRERNRSSRPFFAPGGYDTYRKG